MTPWVLVFQSAAALPASRTATKDVGSKYYLNFPL